MNTKLRKSAILILVLCGIVGLLAGCTGRSNSTTPVQTQLTAVQRGNITILVTGTGNLALEKKQSLSFNQTGLAANAEAAKIAEVSVVEGQTVDQGQVLVKADSKDWENRVNTLKHQLDSAKAYLVQTQTSVVNAQSNLATMQYNLATAQANLDAAQYNLQAQQDIKAVQDKIDNANIQMQQAKVFLQQSLTDPATKGDAITYWNQTIARYQADIVSYQKDLQNLKTTLPIVGFSVTDITTKQAQVQQAQNGIAQAQAGVDLAKKNIESAQANVIVSQNAVDDAQAALTEEQNGAQQITSPIKGIITRVNVKQGDIVQRNTNIIEIADAEKFEANVMVSERDVTTLTPGGQSTVTFDALPGLNFPARITRIAPLGTIQLGVVNYQVTVELTSTKPAAATGTSTLGTPVNLKDGFSAIVNIPVQEKDNVLIVPSSVISHKGQDYVVQIKTGTATETRVVKIGITDFQNTEIIDGLSQGDQVVIPLIPTAAPTNSGGFFGGGGG